jgi:hypothetical protein
MESEMTVPVEQDPDQDEPESAPTLEELRQSNLRRLVALSRIPNTLDLSFNFIMGNHYTTALLSKLLTPEQIAEAEVEHEVWISQQLSTIETGVRMRVLAARG